VLACVACSPQREHNRPTGPISLTDDAGHAVRLDRPAQRVISLVPSATESLIALGATNQIVGRTRYDTSPEVAGLPSVGGGIDASIEAIVNLKPDLVIAWGSDARMITRDRLVALGVPVFVIKTEDTTDIFRGIASLGRLTGHDSAAASISASVRRDLDDVHRAAAGRPARSVFYVVYNDPPMTAGPRTFISQLIALAGGRSIVTDSSQLWPNIAMEEIVKRDPDLVIVPVGESRESSLEHLRQLSGWRSLRAVREGHVVTVPADLANRPSPAIATSARVLLKAIHPEIATDSNRAAR
jgi:iron complex transport system substrate-binding protein